MKPALGLAASLCDVDDAGFAKVDEHGRTSRPGVFVVGNASNHRAPGSRSSLRNGGRTLSNHGTVRIVVIGRARGTKARPQAEEAGTALRQAAPRIGILDWALSCCGSLFVTTIACGEEPIAYADCWKCVGDDKTPSEASGVFLLRTLTRAALVNCLCQEQCGQWKATVELRIYGDMWVYNGLSHIGEEDQLTGVCMTRVRRLLTNTMLI